MKQTKTVLLVMLLAMVCLTAEAIQRKKFNFNSEWKLAIGDFVDALKPDFDDSQWQPVTLPYAFNGDEAFRKDIVDLTDTISWYRKKFIATNDMLEGKVFVTKY